MKGGGGKIQKIKKFSTIKMRLQMARAIRRTSKLTSVKTSIVKKKVAETHSMIFPIFAILILSLSYSNIFPLYFLSSMNLPFHNLHFISPYFHTNLTILKRLTNCNSNVGQKQVREAKNGLCDFLQDILFNSLNILLIMNKID